jgi:sugar lactone lactonase YvrE
VDAEGNLWVADYRRPGDDQPRWTVFDPTGAMLGVVETPERFSIHQIGSDFVLGSWADDMDVEHVRLYRLIK